MLVAIARYERVEDTLRALRYATPITPALLLTHAGYTLPYAMSDYY